MFIYTKGENIIMSSDWLIPQEVNQFLPEYDEVVEVEDELDKFEAYNYLKKDKSGYYLEHKESKEKTKLKVKHG